MDSSLSNTANVVGTYNSLPTSITSDAVVVALINNITITKTADKSSWGTGPLTYTITVDNKETESFENPVITDTIDTSLVTFVEDSVMIDGVKAEESEYNYDSDTHTLTVNLKTIEGGNSSKVTFQVTKNAWQSIYLRKRMLCQSKR